MIWIILFFIIILVSAVLAFRSMRDYEEFPDSIASNTLFYIANPQKFNEISLEKLHDFFLTRKQFFSLERLNKGQERALVIFGPGELPEILPELNLIEIEDYVSDAGISAGRLDSDKTVSVDDSLTWLLEPKSVSKKLLHVGNEIKEIQLAQNQKFFMQIVCLGENIGGKKDFQISLRVMVVDQDSIEKVLLAKKVSEVLETATGLKKHEDNFPESKKFDSYKQRSLIPKEVSAFPLNTQEIFALLS